MIDLDALDPRAEKATPETLGNWRYRRCNFGHGPDHAYSYVEWGKRYQGYGTAALSPTMARYIAALAPTTVRELTRLARIGQASDERVKVFKQMTLDAVGSGE